MGLTAVPRKPFLALGAASLIAGILAGLWRLDWPVPGGDWAALHGPLMVCGFFGTVIGLERAVALGRSWAYAAPAASAAGGIAMIAGFLPQAAVLTACGATVFLAVAIVVVRRQSEPFTKLMALGALCWVIGSLLWLAGAPVSQAAPLWAAFLVLTIAGERLELSRFMPPSKWRLPTLAPALGLVGIGAAQAAIGAGPAWTVFGVGLVLLTGWSLRHDIVRRTVRQPGLPRYTAWCLISGYAWLAVAGLIAPFLDQGIATPLYDAALHALFVGFVFSMVFGHAPVILPAVIGVRLPFHPIMYAPLVVLHGSLMLRLAGDLAGMDAVRAAGGLANAVAIVFFIAVSASRVFAGKKNPKPSGA